MQLKRILYFNMHGSIPNCIGYWDQADGFRTLSGEPCTECYLHELAHGQTLPIAQYVRPGSRHSQRVRESASRIIPGSVN